MGLAASFALLPILCFAPPKTAFAPPAPGVTVIDVAASIVKNDIAVETGAGILLETRGNDASVISGNHITATNGSVAIQVASPATPNTGKHRIEKNIISGFAQRLSLDRAKHPGTVTD